MRKVEHPCCPIAAFEQKSIDLISNLAGKYEQSAAVFRIAQRSMARDAGHCANRWEYLERRASAASKTVILFCRSGDTTEVLSPEGVLSV